MEVHFSLNQKFPLLPEHFNRWQALFFQTIDTLFSGPLAEEAKQKASSIANLMQFKINQQGIDITLKQKPDESQPDSQI